MAWLEELLTGEGLGSVGLVLQHCHRRIQPDLNSSVIPLPITYLSECCGKVCRQKMYEYLSIEFI